MSLYLFLVLCIAVGVQGRPEEGESKHWALIVAGSKGYRNYRHQADACHAYQIMLKHGIPEERIVLMMYDDIAHNQRNPTPGVLINHPKGPDVYGGVKIDYREKDVSARNFLNVLLGKQESMKGIGSGKVINSGPNDHVFVNFVDHGGQGVIAFPNSILSARRLNKAIMQMYREKRYKQMVFYVEACESGSMFGIYFPKNINVYATTAAGEAEASFAIYYSNKYHTYLGDVYSVKWMEDSDAYQENLKTETLQKQYTLVKKETTTSHVQEFGNKASIWPTVTVLSGIVKQDARLTTTPSLSQMDAVPSGDVPMAILRHRLVDTNDFDEKMAIVDEMKLLLENYQVIRRTVREIVTLAIRDDRLVDHVLNERRQLSDFACYEPTLEMFHEMCFNLGENEYALRQLYVLANLCEEGISPVDIVQSIVTVCNGSFL
ncbi:hypothetical protein NP493_1940g00004 [Ridgeia piscesae]|uniref:Hemoglobinase n=1 Tax=Ridgeia piscesae TaxID=27915 RepID=A0AAD9JPE2_RIDPI|nr:hypothetical protein NP493_1940g00004 [Ridgeia piscesae]